MWFPSILFVSLSLSLYSHACHARARLLHMYTHRDLPPPSPPSPPPTRPCNTNHNSTSLMRTVIMVLIRSSSLMATWVLSTSASPWSKHTVPSKYLREEVEMVFLGHSAQHAPVHL